MSVPPSILLSGGGTGGHIFPAVAIANAIRAEYPGARILFIGATGRMEMEKIPASGYEVKGLPIAGLQRKQWWKNWNLPIKLIRSLNLARKYIREFAPDVVVGTGGYASGPTLRVAASMGIPTLIQEQNSFPGITNKVLASKVNRICVAYPGMEKYFPREKILLTGNPVRKDILELNGRKEEGIKSFGLDPGKPVLLVIGGSLGARTINESILAGINTLERSGWQLVWQTGKNMEGEIRERIGGSECKHVKASAFIQRMDLAYAVADLVVSRAGALSVSEICVAGKAAILVPSPNVAEDHQTKNARALVNEGAAILVSDRDAAEKLVQVILACMHNEQERKKLSVQAGKLAKPQAAELIAAEVLSLIKKT